MNGHGRVLYQLEGSANLIQIQLKDQNLSLPSYIQKQSTGPDWSLCMANSGPRVLCLTPLI